MSDTISRAAAIDYCYALINAENPSDPSDEWNYSQERINQTEVILHHLEFMSSAQPERKKGKWINRSLNILYPERERYTCSVCGKHSYNYDFCPNCGSYNGGENYDKG